MKEISYRLRKALVDSLEPLTYQSVEVPIFDQRVNPNTTIPVISGAECYVLINSQTNTETTNSKCKIRLDANINFDVITKYPQGWGGMLHAEKIGEIILDTVNRSLIIPDFDVLNVQMNFNQNLIENGTSEDAYRKIISYRFDVFEK